MACGDHLSAGNITHEINFLQLLEEIRRKSYDHASIADKGGLAVRIDEVHEPIVDAAIFLAMREMTIARATGLNAVLEARLAAVVANGHLAISE